MSRKSYPCIGRAEKREKGLCNCCPEKAVMRVDIQVDWFRGNDEVYQLCASHFEWAKELRLIELSAAMRAEKDRRRAASIPKSQRAAIELDADREMIGDDAEHFGLTNIGNK